MNTNKDIRNNDIVIGVLIVLLIGIKFIGEIRFDKYKFDVGVFSFQTTNSSGETSVKVSHPTRPKLRNPLR